MFTATKDTVHDLKNSAQNVKDEATSAAYGAKADIRSAANETGKRVRDFIDNARDELTHATDSVNSQIHAKPVQATFAALGVGFLLGVLYRR